MGPLEHAERRNLTLVETFVTIARNETGSSPQKIVQVTGHSAETVEKAVGTLIDRGYVRAPGQLRDQETAVHVVDDCCVLGVRILPTRLIGVVTNLRCRTLTVGGQTLRMEHPLENQGASVDTVISGVTQLTRDLTQRLPRDYKCLGLGVELGGHIHPASGQVIYSPNLQWHDVPLGKRLREATTLEVTVENDVNALAVAEQWFGDGHGIGSFAVILLAEGIGCGLVVNNDLFHGASGIAGELGHIVVDPDGPNCRCGNRGCLESIATDRAILRAIKTGKPRHEKAPGTVAEAVRLARDGDVVARDTFRHAGEALARAISILLNVLNPEKIIIHSLHPQATELLWERVDGVLPTYTFSTAFRDCDIKRKMVAVDLGAQGAAAVAISQFLNLSQP
ncbi:MAG: ROK family protein [Pseudonocardiaceae bacterium]